MTQRPARAVTAPAQSMTRGIAALTAVVTAALAIAATALFTAAAGAQEAASDSGMPLGDMVLGNPDADVTVVEYASYTCPHCANFHADGYKSLKADYIDTGKIQFIYREVYFDRYGLWAGMLARCGGEDRYFGITDLLYETQREWVTQDDGEVADNLRRLGRQAGLTNDEINACLNDGDAARALVAAYQENANADNVRSTPTFIIDGELVTNRPWEELKAVIDTALAD